MIATEIRDVFRTADPTLPLQSGDERYVDCTAVRGEEDVVDQLFDTISWSQRRTTQLFTGHRGCGKSTELLRLKDRLEQADYAVVYFEADDLLDLNDLVYSDILIAIVRQIYTRLEEMEIELDPRLIEQIMEWFGEVIYEYESVESAEVALAGEFKIGTPKLLSPLAQMMAKITGQLRTGIESKQHVRHRLEPQISHLIDNINLLLAESNLRLQEQGKVGMVVIIDNLDRISFRSLGERNTHDALYIDHGEQLTSLGCHVIYTVPIAMFYSIQASILRGFFSDHLIMPMIKIRTRDGQSWDTGLAILHGILGQRIDLDRIFEEAALDLLCETSGGHPRDLMILVRYACRYAAKRMPKPITVDAAQKAANRLVSEYSRMIPEHHLSLLAQVHHDKQVKNDEEHQAMLHNLSVLEYRNGAPPWHDVHPAVLALPKFQALEDS